MTYDLKAAIAAAAKTSPNMNEAQSGGGGYDLPAAGLARARFVGYFEVGKHEEEFQGQKKLREKVGLVFELSGPNHPLRSNGEPHRITAWETKSLSERSHFFKLFRQMNYAGKTDENGKAFSHMSQLLGEAYLVEIVHSKSPDGKRTYVNLRGRDGYNVKGTRVQDAANGQWSTIDVAPPLTEVKAFFWDQASKAGWDAIYIDGEYPEYRDEKTGEVIRPARSKNVIQDRCRSAKNFGDIAALVESDAPPLPDAQTPPRASDVDGDDPLAGIG